MNRQQKESLIDNLHKQFVSSAATYVIGYSGLSVNAISDLRSKLREHKAQLKVAKMRLTKRAVAAVPALGGVEQFLREQRGIVFVSSEPTAVAKVLYEFSKQNERLAIIAGYVENEIIDAEAIKTLALLPSRDVLRAQVLGAMLAPMAKLVMVLSLIHKKLSSQDSQGEPKEESVS